MASNLVKFFESASLNGTNIGYWFNSINIKLVCSFSTTFSSIGPAVTTSMSILLALSIFYVLSVRVATVDNISLFGFVWFHPVEIHVEENAKVRLYIRIKRPDLRMKGQKVRCGLSWE